MKADDLPNQPTVSEARLYADAIETLFAEVAAVLNPALAQIVKDLEALFDDPQIRAALDPSSYPRHPRDPRRRKWPQERGIRERRQRWAKDE